MATKFFNFFEQTFPEFKSDGVNKKFRMFWKQF